MTGLVCLTLAGAPAWASGEYDYYEMTSGGNGGLSTGGWIALALGLALASSSIGYHEACTSDDPPEECSAGNSFVSVTHPEFWFSSSFYR